MVPKTKILAFSTDDFIKVLCESLCVYMDGTHYACSKQFSQIYVLHAIYKTSMIPVVYGLLPGHSSAVYLRFLRLVREAAKERGYNFCPPNFQIDFETGMIAAIKTLFPESTVRGCFFHYTQAIWRAVKSRGLTQLYRNDKEVRKNIRRLMALALVPVEDQPELWITIQNGFPTGNSNIVHLLDYFVDTWMENSVHPVEMWNHFGNF